MGETRASNQTLTVEMLDEAFQSISRSYDARHGGFGSAPKFPAAMNLEFCLRIFQRTGRADALEMVKHTCRKMAEGGLYDQLGGGFHRYSTDARWLVPHFEKMLYDNALLSRLYLHVYQATGDEFFRRIVEETLDYVVREMTDASGGFYSTQDADSEGVEGKFFVWSVEEINQLLGAEDGALFAAYYGATPAGNFEEQNILNVERPAEALAKELKVTVERLRQAVERGRRVLLAARESRIKPARDEKVLTAWNGLMLASFAEASAILERPDYRAVAERNAEFILRELRREGFLLHVYKDGQAKYKGYLDDYAFVISGLITLYETTGAARWLEESVALTERLIDEFWDEAEGGFFYTGKSGERLIVRVKDFFDNATPSGNSVAVELLLRLSVLTENESYGRKATTILRLVRDQMARYPSAFGLTLGALDFYLSTPKEIVVVGPSESPETRALLREVWQRYLPNKVVAQGTEGDEDAARVSTLLQNRPMQTRKPTAYVCENRTCKRPVNSPQDLAAQLDDGAGRTVSGIS
jgi:uncharacterized protein YyaL (SSP411 family)